VTGGVVGLTLEARVTHTLVGDSVSRSQGRTARLTLYLGADVIAATQTSLLDDVSLTVERRLGLAYTCIIFTFVWHGACGAQSDECGEKEDLVHIHGGW